MKKKSYVNQTKVKSKVKLSEFDPSTGFSRQAGSLKFIAWYLVKIVFFLSAFPFPSGFKVFLLRIFGAKVGRQVTIKPRVNIHFPWKLSVGNNVWLGEEVFILNFENLTIGNNVCISQRAFLCGGNHNYQDPAMSYRNGPIDLQDGCWIGASTFVSPGVTVGIDTIVTAGSVVTSSLPENGIYKGNPISYVKKRWK